jgi:hypothetical protein
MTLGIYPLVPEPDARILGLVVLRSAFSGVSCISGIALNKEAGHDQIQRALASICGVDGCGLAARSL